MTSFWLRAAAVAVAAFATAAAFSAYLKPGMLVEFANFILCS
jgi:hypothetical protein